MALHASANSPSSLVLARNGGYLESKRAASGAVRSLVEDGCDYVNFRSRFFESGMQNDYGVLLRLRARTAARVFSKLSLLQSSMPGIPLESSKKDLTIAIGADGSSFRNMGMLSAAVWHVVRTSPLHWVQSNFDETKMGGIVLDGGKTEYGSTNRLMVSDHKIVRLLSDSNYSITFVPNPVEILSGCNAHFSHAWAFPPEMLDSKHYSAQIVLFYLNATNQAYKANENKLAATGKILPQVGIKVQNFPAGVVASFEKFPANAGVPLLVRIHMAMLAITATPIEEWNGLIRGNGRQ